VNYGEFEREMKRKYQASAEMSDGEAGKLTDMKRGKGKGNSRI
jgi:hypothetical protein